MIKKNPLSFQLKVDDFLPATEEERLSLTQLRPSVSFFKDDGSPLGNLPISLIEAQYPDWKRAVDGFDVKAVEEIGVDLTFIADAAKVAKAYGKPYGRFEFRGVDRAMKIHFNVSAWMSIMPCRI